MYFTQFCTQELGDNESWKSGSDKKKVCNQVIKMDDQDEDEEDLQLT